MSESIPEVFPRKYKVIILVDIIGVISPPSRDNNTCLQRKQS